MRKGLGKYLFMGLFLLLFSFSSTAFAEENESDFEIEPQPTPLTTEERSYLIEVSGFTNKQVDNLHPETAREIISQEGKVVASGEVDVQLEKPQGQIVPFGYLYDSDVTMAYVVVKTTDDLSGYKKYFATGGFQWKKQPVNYYVDKFSIGFPSHMG